jgi:uncharacterized protein DUF2188
VNPQLPEKGVHVRPDGTDWEVAGAGTLVKYPTRSEAVEAGRRIAAAGRMNLVIVSGPGLSRSAAQPNES